MKAALQDYWLVWRYAIQYPAKPFPRGLIVLLFLAASGLTMALPIFVLKGDIRPWFGTAMLLVVIVSGALWHQLLQGVILTHPLACAKLVPRTRNPAFSTVFFSWLILSTVAACTSLALAGEFWWGFLVFGSAVLFMEFPSWVLFLPGLSVYGPQILPPAISAILKSNVILTLYALVLIRFLYLRLAASLRHGASTPSRPGTIGVSPDISGWLWAYQSGSLSSHYRATLQRDCANQQARHLIGHVAGPLSFRRTQFAFFTAGLKTWQKWAQFSVLAVAMIGWRTYLANAPNGLHQAAPAVLVATLALIMLAPAFRFAAKVSHLAQTGQEQKLFLLTPGAPSHIDINRYLARHLLQNSLLDWLALAAGLTLFDVLLGTPPHLLLLQLSLFTMSLPLMGAILTDYSAKANQQIHFSSIIAPVFLLWFLSLLYLAVAETGPSTLLNSSSMIEWYLKRDWLGLTQDDIGWHTGFIACNMLLAAIVLASRWRAMLKAAPAFPVGRFSA
jgi:hypothetical protein